MRGAVVGQEFKSEERAQPGVNDRTLFEVEPLSSGDDERDGLAKRGVQSEEALLERVWCGHGASMLWRSSFRMRERTCSAVFFSR